MDAARRNPSPLLSLACLVLCAPAPCLAQDKVDKAALDAALDKGLAYLGGLQRPDGSFALPDTKGGTLEKSFPMGTTSLATLTLLKCGTPPGAPAIESAFRYLYTLPLRRTYSISLLILCIEARYAPPKKLLKKKKNKKRSYPAVARRFFRGKAPKVDQVKLQQCVDYLVKNRSSDQQGAGWRYPSTEAPDQDNSCTQYAMLALKGARRLGANVPLEVFEKVADFLVAQQDATGPEMPWFPVPAADGPIHDMLSIEQRKKADRRAKKRRAKHSGTRQREKSGGEGSERRAMHARGWSYLPRKVEGPPPADRAGPVPGRPASTQASTGSMTGSGIAALCIAKSELENNPPAWRRRRDAVNQAIRDGCAWLSKYFSPTANPSTGTTGATRTTGWKYYYLYSCERAGVLAGTYRFGAHDWWEEGAAHLIAQQQDEGSWPDAKGLSRLGRTCFALLFLKRATIPLVPLPPKRVMTGDGR